MNIESRTVASSKSPEDLYAFLTSVKNYQQLMPEGTKFDLVDDDKFNFTLKGMPEIRLGLGECTPNEKVSLISTSDKFDFALNCDIQDKGESSEAQLSFTGDLNPMIAMMVKSPLKKLLEQLITGIEGL